MAESLNMKYRGFASKKWFILTLILFISVLLPLSSTIADDTLVGGSGSNIMPIKSKDIQLIYEKVIVHIGQPYTATISAFPVRRAFVNCVFVLKNTSKKTIKAQTGFPGGIVDEDVDATMTDLHSFKATSDGVESRVEKHKKIMKGEPGETGEYKPYRSWYTWDVIFPPLKEVTIKNSYWVNLSTDQDTWWFKYILVTGANWKGNIKKAIIEVIYPSAADLISRVIKIEPSGNVIEGNKIYWVFNNFKPNTDIMIQEKFRVEESSKVTETALNVGNTLIWAARLDSTGTIKRLIAKGVGVNVTDSDGLTALMVAADAGNTDIVKLLLEHGADVNAKAKDNSTALIRASFKEHKDIVKLLLKYGADINAKDEDGETALMLASMQGYIGIVKSLLDNGADVNAKDNDGLTALMFASSAGSIDTVKLLLKHKADANAKDNHGETALANASNKGYTVIVSLLKAAGAK